MTLQTSVAAEFNALNFERIKYVDSRGRKQDAYMMTRDGFTMLVMGYTGKKAFEAVEEGLRDG